MRVFDLINSLAGWTACRVSGALPAAFLNGCASGGVTLLSAEAEGDYVLLVRIRSRDLAKARRAALHAQCTLERVGEGGAPRLRRLLARRCFAAAALLAAAGILAWSRLYIWDIDVYGNQSVPTARILDALRECGITEGSFWPGITSDSLRSELLVELPELSWATVNIYGSRAEVLVRERTRPPQLWDAESPVDIVAEKAGVVTEVRALNGSARTGRGKAVLPGEILIEGRAESAYSGTRRVHAAGSVRAETYYELSAAVPLTRLEKQYTGKRHSLWSLSLGKNRWNFFGNSSILGDGCDRITNVWSAGLGGVFTLPVSLRRETALEYVLAETPRDLNAARRELEETLDAWLLRLLGAGGTVEASHYSVTEADGLLKVCLRARCTEDIGCEAPSAAALPGTE